jgi:phage N-6-adenine-methyltransferase
MSRTYTDWYRGDRHQAWGTPADLFAGLHREFGFTLDGAADDDNALLDVASTPSNPRPWVGERVFCNPPWSDIAPFVEMAARADLAVLLVPARTNVRWFHRALEMGATLRYFKGRPKFVNPDHRGAGHNSPVDCLLLIFRAESEEVAS